MGLGVKNPTGGDESKAEETEGDTVSADNNNEEWKKGNNRRELLCSGLPLGLVLLFELELLCPSVRTRLARCGD
jgi:hypothetical protein